MYKLVNRKDIKQIAADALDGKIVFTGGRGAGKISITLDLLLEMLAIQHRRANENKLYALVISPNTFARIQQQLSGNIFAPNNPLHNRLMGVPIWVSPNVPDYMCRLAHSQKELDEIMKPF